MKASLFLNGVLIFSAPVLADIGEDVRCAEIAFSRSVETQNITLFESFIDADARFVGSSVQRGVADITAAWSVFFSDDSPQLKWRPQIIEVLKDGRLALSRGPYRMTVQDADGEESEHWGTFNSVWRMQDDGSWKVVFDAGNEVAETPSEETQALLDREADCP